MRLLGILLVSIAPVIVGFLSYRKLVKSQLLLSELKKLCGFWSSSVRFSLKEPNRLFEEVLGSPNFSDDIKKIIGAAKGKNTFGEIFSSIETADTPFLPKDQIGILSDMFFGFGKSDLEAETTRLKYFTALFESKENDLKELCKTKGRLYISLSFALGAALFVFLV